MVGGVFISRVSWESILDSVRTAGGGGGRDAAGSWVYATGILLCGLLAWSLRVGGADRFAAITLSIILLIPRARAPWITGWHRFLEVSLGIAVALVVTTVWPLPKPHAAPGN